MTEPEFEIYIRSLTGKTIILYTRNEETILDLKNKIFEKEGIPTQQQRLIFNSKNVFDENKTIPYYAIKAGSTLDLVIRLENYVDYTHHSDDGDDKLNYNENWYYLENVDTWKPFDRFISLILSCRYNENIRNKTFVLFSSFGESAKRVRYLFEFKDNGRHEMYEPNNYLISYGYLNHANIITCDIPPNHVINDEIELLYLLRTNRSNRDIEIAIKEHLSLLPHPSDAFLFGTWFAELLYSFEWMINEEIKLNNFIILNNMDSLQFTQQYLNNKRLFKQTMKDKCGIPFGVGHSLYNHLKNTQTRSCIDIYHAVLQFFNDLKHEKIMEIQLIFLKNDMNSTHFFNQYLKNDNQYLSDTKLRQFLKNILSLKVSHIQRLIRSIKASFQINTNDKIMVKDDMNANIVYNIDRRRATTLIKAKGQKAITSFNIWLSRNVIYSKKELMKQQNDVKRYIEQSDLGSLQLAIMGKKLFIQELHSKCEIPIGPLNLLYDTLPTQDTDDYTANEIVEFICNYLYELRYNNIQRMRDRCIASNINDEQFAKSIAPNKNNALAHYLRDHIKIKSNYKINQLIPKIQHYAHNLYTDFDMHIDIHISSVNLDKKGTISAAFGTWLSELCFERKKLSEQQQLIEGYIRNIETVHPNDDYDNWDFRKLLMDRLQLDPLDVVQIMEHIQNMNITSHDELISHTNKMLYDARTLHMARIRSRCNYLAQQGIDDDYFLNNIVVNNIKLEKFLMHDIDIDTDEIPQLIQNIRHYLEELRIINIQSEDTRAHQETAATAHTHADIYGNKVGRWIGEIIHDRLIYLIAAKTMHDFIVVNHWDSGILPHIGKQRFVHHLKQCVYGNVEHILNEIWKRLQRRYINNADAFHATHNKVALDVFEYMREMRRAHIFQIAVECSTAIECVDAKTFYTKIGSNKTVLRKFINKIVKNTNQEIWITSSESRELITEKIYYLLSVDVEDNNVSFEHWLSNIIYDPVTLWLNITQMERYINEENINASRAKQWGKHRFEQKASVACNSLTADQMNQFFNISKRNEDKDDVFDCIAEKLRKQHANKRNKCKRFMEEKNVNKLSFLNVTATSNEKLIEFIDKDLGISYDKERNLVNAIRERLRLCLKIHTNLFDNAFGDEYKDAMALEVELNIETVDEKESKTAADTQVHSEWIEPYMFQMKEFNNHELAFALCYSILNEKSFETRISSIYNRFVELIRVKQMDGNYLSQYIVSAKRQIDVDKQHEIDVIKQRIQEQKQEPWEYKQFIHELETKEVVLLAEQCLLTANCIPYYNKKIENIAQKIMDTNMNGTVFVNNLNLNKNVFVHRMMECFGDESNYKFVQSIYDDLSQNKDICNEIADYNALMLSNYLKRYQMERIKTMMMQFDMNGKALKEYKRHEFAAKLKDICSLPIGIGTMLYTRMMSFSFMTMHMEPQHRNVVNYIALLRDNPSIEFVSLITKTLDITDKSLCNEFWNYFLQKYDNGELQIMEQHEIMRYMYGFRVNTFYNNLLSEIHNNDDGNKYRIAEKWIKTHFKWLDDDTKYANFDNNFNKYIGEYFKSDLMLIIIYKQKYDLLKDDGVRFLLRLDFNHINYDTLCVLKDNEIDLYITNHKKGYNARNVENIMREIKVFIKKERRLQETKCASWKLSDIALYLMRQIFKQMRTLNTLDTLDTLFCIKYFSVFIEEYIKNPSNDMTQLISRKAKNQVLYQVEHDIIPQIASDIFISWIKEKVPLDDGTSGGIGSTISRGITRVLSAFSNN